MALDAKILRDDALSEGAGASRDTPCKRGEVLFELARALHVAGAPSWRVEATFAHAARRLGLQAQVLSNPTSLIVALGSAGEDGVRLARVEPGEVHLSRLAAIDALLEDFEQGRVEAAEVRRRLRVLEAGAGRVPAWVDPLVVGLASGTAASFFGGSILDLTLAGVLAAAITALGPIAGRSEHRRPLFEPAGALLAAFTSTALSRLGVPIDALAVTLAALIALVPGYSLTVAMSELAGRHLVSGVARLASAAGTLLGIGLGVGLGQALGERVLLRAPLGVHTAVGEPGVWLAVVTGALAFSVLFRARREDAPAILCASLAAFAGGRVGAELLGPELGGLLGALVLGLASNAAARWTRRPASTVLCPGLMILVPGSLGFRSVSQFLQADALSGVETGFRAAIVATSLVGGLLAANLALSPRRAV